MLAVKPSKFGSIKTFQISKNVKPSTIQKRNFNEALWFSAACVGLMGGSALMSRYKISASNQYLVRTGFLIPDIKISKKGFLLPFQSCKYIDMTPRNYEFSLHAMSHEKLEFILPVVFTIGPKDNMVAAKLVTF
jgi:hypothetical protein